MLKVCRWGGAPPPPQPLPRGGTAPPLDPPLFFEVPNTHAVKQIMLLTSALLFRTTATTTATTPTSFLKPDTHDFFFRLKRSMG